MIDKDYVDYVLQGDKLTDFTSKNLVKYNKVINLLTEYKDQYLSYSRYYQEIIFKYIISKLDKRVKFVFDYMENDKLTLLFKLFRDIDFTGASALEIKEIQKEFQTEYYTNREIERLLEDMKNNDFIEIESRADLNQIRFSTER